MRSNKQCELPVTAEGRSTAHCVKCVEESMVIKCEMCGGDLLLKEGSSFATCAYCGSTMTVSQVDDERMEQLLQGIREKIDGAVTSEQSHSQLVQQVVCQGDADALLQRGTLALEQKDWQNAAVFFEAVLNQKAESAEAYLGKYLAAMHYCGIEDMQTQRIAKLAKQQGTLTQACAPQEERIDGMVRTYVVSGYLEEADIRAMCQYDLSYYSRVAVCEECYQREKHLYEENLFLSHAMQFADEAFKRKLTNLQVCILKEAESALNKAKEDDIRSVERITADYEAFLTEAQQRLLARKSEAESALEEDYLEACQAKAAAHTSEELGGLAALFERISFYKESEKLAAECRRSEEEAKASELAVADKLERDYALACDRKVNARTGEDWAEAARLFATCGAYKNSHAYMEQCKKQAEQLKDRKSGWKFV